MKYCIGLQMEGIDGAIRADIPAGCKGRHNFEVRVKGDQTLKDQIIS